MNEPHPVRPSRGPADGATQDGVGRTALITGGTGGLGACVVALFLAHGWRVVAPHRRPAGLEALRSDTLVAAAGSRLAAVRTDLLDPKSVGACVEVASAEADFPLAAVVNLAGGFASGARVHETPLEDFEAQLSINLRSAYLVCAASLAHLLDRKEGAIVCVSTRAARRPFAGAAGYIVSKAAVLALVDALAVEYTADGVRTNAILPSVIDTASNRAAQPDADHSRWVTPAAIAEVVHFLCSPASSPTSGAHVPVYGRS